jgi:hypothetical protein
MRTPPYAARVRCSHPPTHRQTINGVSADSFTEGTWVTDEAVAAADGAFLVKRTKTGKMIFVKKVSVDRANHRAKCREQASPPPRLGQYCPTAYTRKRMHDELGDFVVCCGSPSLLTA